MTTQPTLPTECLEAIVNRICDIQTLFSLLTVNRVFFIHAVRRLYYNPFWWFDVDYRTEKMEPLMQLILQLSPVKDADTDHLRKLLAIEPLPVGYTPMVDYLSYVRTTYDFNQYHIRFDDSKIQELADELGRDSWFGALSRVQKVILWAICGPNMEHMRSIQIPMWDIDQYENAFPRMNRIEEIEFDVNTGYSDDMHYTEIQYFKRATVFMQRFLIYRCSSSISSPTPSQQLSDKGRQRQINISFVNTTLSSENEVETKKLQRDLFKIMSPIHQPHTLDERNWIRFTAHPLDTDLSQLTTFNLTSSTITWSDLQSTSPNVRPSSILQRCRRLKELTILLPDGDDREELFAWAAREKDFAIDHEIDKKDGETVHLENEGTRNSPHSTKDECQNSPQHQHQHQQLVQLHSLSVDCRYSSGMAVLQDAMYGFGHSLREVEFHNMSIDGEYDVESELDGTGNVDMHAADNDLKESSSQPRRFVGENWDLPHLKDLALLSNKVLPLADQVFDHMPNLDSLVIFDYVSSYTLSDHQWRRLAPWTAFQHLSSIDLSGQIACEFHPASLKHLPNLVSLTLRGLSPGRYCCPHSYTFHSMPELAPASASASPSPVPVSEHDGAHIQGTSALSSKNLSKNRAKQRMLHDTHLYTWDWFMPSLQSVTLEGELAIRFDFKWVLYCPRLDKLILDVTGHRCMMTLDALREDLKLDEMKEESLKEDDRNHGNNNNNNAHDINNGDKNTSLNRLKSSPLTNLELHGRIAISDADIQELLTFCPELNALTLHRTRQYTLSSLITTCNRHQTLERVAVSRSLNNKQLNELGLIHEPEPIYRSWLDRTLNETSTVDEEVISNVYRPVYYTPSGYYVSPSMQVMGEEMEEEVEEEEAEYDNCGGTDWLSEMYTDIFS